MELGLHGSEENVLTVSHLEKRIRGKAIVQDISFTIESGEIFGFLGPNGAGKTTTIRMLVGLIKPSSGTVKICGYDVQRHFEKAISHAGCIVENPEAYNYLSGWDNLLYASRMMDGVSEARIREVVSLVKLDKRIHDKVKTYSLGMKQRLGIAQALLGNPKLLILDEPTNGLDPKGIKELRHFIESLARKGLSIFISSHMLGEIQQLCDRVGILYGGRMLACGSVSELLGSDGTEHVIWQFERPEDAIQLLTLDEHIELVDREQSGSMEDLLIPGAILTRMNAEHIADTVKRLVDSNIRVQAVHMVPLALEDLFLQMTEGE